MTVDCCECSCIVCKAVVTRSSDTCSGFCAGETVVEEPSQPFQAPLQPCFHQVLRHRPWLEELLLLIGHRRKQQACAHTWAPYTSASLVTKRRARQAERRKTGVKTRKATEGSEELTLARQCGQRRTHHRMALGISGHKSCAALSSSLGAFLFLASFRVPWQPSCACFVQQYEFRRGA